MLVQEVQRVNSLLTVVRSSLTDLGKAVRGLALMSADLDAVGRALFDGKVPAMWLKKSFPSLKVPSNMSCQQAMLCSQYVSHVAVGYYKTRAYGSLKLCRLIR